MLGRNAGDNLLTEIRTKWGAVVLACPLLRHVTQVVGLLDGRVINGIRIRTAPHTMAIRISLIFDTELAQVTSLITRTMSTILPPQCATHARHEHVGSTMFTALHQLAVVLKGGIDVNTTPRTNCRGVPIVLRRI